MALDVALSYLIERWTKYTVSRHFDRQILVPNFEPEVNSVGSVRMAREQAFS